MGMNFFKNTDIEDNDDEVYEVSGNSLGAVFGNSIKESDSKGTVKEAPAFNYDKYNQEMKNVAPDDKEKTAPEAKIPDINEMAEKLKKEAEEKTGSPKTDMVHTVSTRTETFDTEDQSVHHATKEVRDKEQDKRNEQAEEKKTEASHTARKRTVSRKKDNGSMLVLPEGISFHVEGTLSVDTPVEIKGSFEGTLSAGNIRVTSRRLRKAVLIADTVELSKDSNVVAELDVSKSLVIDGAYKGNIETEGDVIIGPDAYVLGNIKAGHVSVDNNAVVRGMITLISNDNDDSRNISFE